MSVTDSNAKDTHKHVLQINNSYAIEYYHIPRKRIKTSEIIVGDENDIIVRTPFDKSCTEVQNLMKTKKYWILRKQKEFDEQNKRVEITKPTFSENSTLPYLGRNLPIEIIESEVNNGVELINKKFVFYIRHKDSEDNAEIIKSLYQNWIENQASEIFAKKVTKFAKIIKVRPKEVSIKNLRKRWGSTTKKGTINLNVNLIKAPERIIDYVIVHELCHFLIEEHSFRFWNMLKRYFPDYLKYVEWLNINGKNLLT